MKKFQRLFQENRNTNRSRLCSLGSTLIHRGSRPLPVSRLTKWRIIAGK